MSLMPFVSSVAKAKVSLPMPKTKAAASRRAARYGRFASATDDPRLARIAALEAERHGAKASAKRAPAKSASGSKGKRSVMGETDAFAAKRPSREPKTPYDATSMRPRNLKEARQWAAMAHNRARATGHYAVVQGMEPYHGAVANPKTVRQAARLNRRAEAAQRIVTQWEAAKRPPKGFRRGAVRKSLMPLMPFTKASLYGSSVRELRETAARYGVPTKARSRKREIVDALRTAPKFREDRSKSARQLREARGLIRDLNMEVRSPNMVGALRGSLAEAARTAPDAGTRRQMMAAEGKVGTHLFADLDAWKAKEALAAGRTSRDRRYRPKDSYARAYDAAKPSPKRAVRKSLMPFVKMIVGGRAETAQRFAQARAQIEAQPKRRQNTGMMRRLKRAETYLNRSAKRGAPRRARKQTDHPLFPEYRNRFKFINVAEARRSFANNFAGADDATIRSRMNQFERDWKLG